jgi:hypothetical protein
MNGRINNIGIDDIAFIAPFINATIAMPNYGTINMAGLMNGWMRRCYIQDQSLGIYVGTSVRFLTLEDITVVHTQDINNGAGDPLDVAISGSNVLVHRFSGQGNHCHFLTSKKNGHGPNVFLNSNIKGLLSTIGPHMNWGPGHLFDNITLDTEIWIFNQGGTRAWGGGWDTVWNCKASSMAVDNPPIGYNWVIGGSGPYKSRAGSSYNETQAIFDDVGNMQDPGSLYLAQLKQRLGGSAMTNIGYPQFDDDC